MNKFIKNQKNEIKNMISNMNKNKCKTITNENKENI